MTSSIGSSNLSQNSALAPLANNRNSKPSVLQQPAGNLTQPGIAQPTAPVGPLGHNINTTA
jgi:hypothetical protein